MKRNQNQNGIFYAKEGREKEEGNEYIDVIGALQRRGPSTIPKNRYVLDF